MHALFEDLNPIFLKVFSLLYKYAHMINVTFCGFVSLAQQSEILIVFCFA